MDGGATLQWNGSNTQDISSRLVMGSGSNPTLDVGSNTVSFATGLYAGSGWTKAGSGTLILAGQNDILGSTVISAGTLQVGAGGSPGGTEHWSTITDKSSLVFDRSDSITLPFAINGAGSLTQEGTGTLTLSGSNSYTGGTTISAGILSVATIADSAGSNLSTGPVTLNGGALSYTGSSAVTTARAFVNTAHGGTIQSSASLTLNGPYTGSTQSTLMKLGTGALTLAGTSPNVNLVLDAEVGTVDLAKSRSVNGISNIASGATVLMASAPTRSTWAIPAARRDW